MARSETVTVVFTDLVGSTELAGRLGHDAYELLRQEHFQALRAAVAAHNGSEVKTTGDGLMLAFASAADAVACAIALQQATDQHARRTLWGPFAIRVGVSSGEASREDNDLFGVPVVEAARLCAAAAAGQIVVGDVVRLMARGRGHVFSRLGDLTLKGLAEPVTAYTVAWEPLADETAQVTIPLPPRFATVEPLALFGRTAEQTLLRECWAKASAGERQLVLLAGEAGIGKTRLATEAARAAHAEGAIVLFGSCDEEIGLPYRPFVEALQHYVVHAPEAVLAAHVRAHGGELARLVPELAKRVTDLPAPQPAEPETERYLMFEAAAGLLSAASQENPVLLILDDLHWAAQPEVLLFRHLVRSRQPLRLLMLATYRDSDVSRTHPLTPLLADLRRENGVQRLLVRGLGDDAVVALISALAGHELTDAGIALAQAIQQETDGSPFFVTEILRHLVESRAVFQEGGQWTYHGHIGGLGIPDSVREVIGRRVARLSDATGRILSLAAVIGRNFDLALLARVADTSEDDALDALDEASAAALIHEVGGRPGHFSFSHALIRTALYEGFSAARRTRLHRRVGEALEALTQSTPGTRIDELAHHWIRGLHATRVADVSKAVAYAHQAGDQALASLAYEQAAAHYEAALAVLESHDDATEQLRCDLLLALGDAQRRASDARYRDVMASAAALARRRRDPTRLGLAALGSARPGGYFTSSLGADPALIQLYTEASAALEGRDSLLHARLLGQLAVELIFTPDHTRRSTIARDALAMARRLDDPAALGSALAAHVFAINDPATLAERLSLIAELEQRAAQLESYELGFFAAFHRAGALLESGDGAGTHDAIERMHALAEALHQPFYRLLVQHSRTMLLILRCDPDAEREAFAAFEVGVAGGNQDSTAVLGSQLYVLRHDQGRFAEFADTLRANVEAMPNIPAWRAGLALLYCEIDQLEDARKHFEILGAHDYVFPLDWTWSVAMLRLSETCDYLGDHRAAALLYPQIDPLAHQVAVMSNTILCLGSFAYPCGMLAACLRRWEEAQQHFERALATNTRIGAPASVVSTQRAYAAMLLSRHGPNDTARAAELIAAGLDGAQTLGMAREITRLQRLRDGLHNR